MGQVSILEKCGSKYIKQKYFLQTLKCTTTPVERWTVCTERLERWTERWTVCTERLERRTERWTLCTERLERRTERRTVCTERFERRTVGTLWLRFKNLHFGNPRCLLLSLLLFRYLSICWIINTNYLCFKNMWIINTNYLCLKKKCKSAISGPILINII